ncbi:MAG: hypothetical protein ACW99G_24590 [Candidatus Thorarchaeota archaeon]|jgi:hypothetical protein
MQAKTETASNTILATTGTGLALSPAFYETPEWMGAVAILSTKHPNGWEQLLYWVWWFSF